MLNIINNIIFDAPFDKIQLCDGRGDIIELYSTCSAERVEQFFTIAVETALICHMNCECLPILCCITYLFFLAMVGHKPLDRSQRYLISLVYDRLQCIKIISILIKFCEAFEKCLLFAHTYIALSLYL